jgi:DNA-binding transcriptional LysR family regulator
VRFKGLDLNLLIALDALLDEKSVSRAAIRTFRSQPTMSGALARLREHFQDELLVSVGRKLVLTSFAESLVLPVRNILDLIDNTVDVARKFSPQAAERTFRICVSDFMIELIMPDVALRVARAAPNVILELVSAANGAADMLENGSVDLLLVQDTAASRLFYAEIVREEDYVILGWSGNRHLKAPLGKDEFLRLGRVAARFGPRRTLSSAEIQLQQFGGNQRIELYSSSFITMPRFLVGTDRIALMQRTLAEAHARALPLVIRPLPVDLRPMRIALQNHSARAGDTGIEWLKGVIRESIAAADIEFSDI